MPTTETLSFFVHRPPQRTHAPVDLRVLIGRIAASEILPAAMVRPGRHQSIAAIVAHAGAGLSLDVLTLVAEAGLVLFAVDDLLDEADLAPEEAALRVEQYVTVAGGAPCPEVAFDPIAASIATLRARLLARPGTAKVMGAWTGAMVRMLSAMGEERYVRDGGATPTLANYMACGRDSIGVEMIAMTAWIAADPAGTAARLPSLSRAERSLSMAVRLANDLRSADRERKEGRTNALTLVGLGGENALRHLRDRALAEGRRVLAEENVAATVQGRFIERFAAAICAMYETRDFQQEAA